MSAIAHQCMASQSAGAESWRPKRETGASAVMHRLPNRTHKTFTIKRFLTKKQKQDHGIPQCIQMKTGNKIWYSSERRRQRRRELGL
ncbi:60S ribosomal protein L39-like [Apodemus sylvaticus]|uniref:60S ribosomal protein L39-like n=1 Tax=Apodemus sylvaticus TaxID=10129 RepID=UPI002244D232|nr:60S ribosomal protein L39-like [Apodemus sylvaticus]